jgi:predicted permease
LSERLGAALYRRWLLLLPADLRRRAGKEMEAVFRARHRAARGPIGVAHAWLLEFAGVIAAAVHARLPDPLNAHSKPTLTRRRSRPMDTLLQDVRYAVRAMTRRKAVTALAVLTFGLGIAASTAMFSVVDAVLLKPLPFTDPHEIVSVYTRNDQFAGHPTLGFAAERGSFSTPEFTAVRANGADVLDGLAILSTGGATLYGEGEPERIPVGLTTTDLFSRVLRVNALHGRVFEEEDARSGERVVLLEEAFWRSRFGADTDLVGRTIQFGDQPYTVIGVLPEDVQITTQDVSAWLVTSGDENWGNHWLTAIGRLKDGVTPEQATARLSTALAAVLPADHDAHGVNAFPRQAEETRSVSGPLWLLALASLVLLAVACGNVATLLVGAAIDREQELAVRAALGAKRGRLIRQLLTESALLGVGAAVIGVLLANVATRAFVLLAPPGVPRIADAGIDVKALAFAISAALGCGILFGLIPALNFSRADLRRSMTITTRGSSGDRGRVQGTVVIAELALATVLLVGAGLLARTVIALNAVDPGFATNETLALRFSLPASRLVKDVSNDSARFAAFDALYARMLDEIGSLPGVRGVALTDNLPLSADRGNNDIKPEGYDEYLIAERRFVSPNYFAVMGIRLVEGRSFTQEEDRPDATGTMIISEGLARLAWPGESALGKRVQYWGRDTRVVGVAADIHDEEVQSGTPYAFYVPRRQAGQLGGTFVLRTEGNPVSLAPSLRQRVREVHSDIAIISVQPLSDMLSEQIAGQRYRARLILVFSGLAALFSLMGIYGVTARSVAARTRELGIRMALGARRKGIIGLVLHQAIRLAVMGAALGIAISLLANRAIESYLWGVRAFDPVTLIAIAVLLGGASVLAALAPGLRAARVDPMEALRAE